MTLTRMILISLWAWSASELLLVIVTYTRRSKMAVASAPAAGNSGRNSDRGSLRILWGTIFASIWIGLDYGARHHHNIFGGAVWVAELGLGIFLAGLLFRWAAILSLGRAFSVNVAIREQQALNTAGLYALVRHPSYTGMVFIFLGVGLISGTWISLAVLFVLPMLALSYRIKVEEAALRSAFPAYAEYSRSTRRLIPGIY